SASAAGSSAEPYRWPEGLTAAWLRLSNHQMTPAIAAITRTGNTQRRKKPRCSEREATGGESICSAICDSGGCREQPLVEGSHFVGGRAAPRKLSPTRTSQCR